MGNSAIVGILRALLTADTATFDAALKRSGDSAKAWSKDLNKIGQDATKLGASLTKTLTVPILGVGVGAAKLAIDFESSFAGVRKTVNATEPEFAAMADAFRGLSKEIPVNVNELNRLGEAAGALGIPKAEIVDFARVMALLGVTTNVTADQAAESIAKIQNIFGAAGKDTERFASTLVALGNNGASTESQILEMATRIAGAGNTIGLTQGQVLGFASALSSVGLEAEAGGTAISRVFVDIASAVSKGGKELADFAKVSGMTSAQFKTAFKDDAGEAVASFVAGLGKVKTSGGDLLKTLAALGFSEVRVRDTLLRAAGAGDLLRTSLDLQKTAWVANSALTVEAGKRFETTEAQMTLLWNRIKDVGVTIGNALLPAIQGVIKLANLLIPTIDFLGKVFAALPGPIQLGAIGLGLVLAAAGPVIYIFGQMAIAASALTGAFTATGLASRVLSANLLGLNVAGASSWLIAMATRLGLLAVGFAAGTGAAVLHEQALARLVEAGKDLERADREILIKELELAKALENTNDKQAQKLQTELKALKSGRDQALQAKARLEAEAAVAKAVADSTKKEIEHTGVIDKATEAQKKYNEEVNKGAGDLTGKTLAADIALRNDQVREAIRLGGIHITQMPGLVAQIDKWRQAGAQLTPTLDQVGKTSLSLSGIQTAIPGQLASITSGLHLVTPAWSSYAEAVGLVGINLSKFATTGIPDFSKQSVSLPKPKSLGYLRDHFMPEDLQRWKNDIVSLGNSFEQLAQISGESMSAFSRNLGIGVSSLNQFAQAASATTAAGSFLGWFSALAILGKSVDTALNAGFFKKLAELRAEIVALGATPIELDPRGQKIQGQEKYLEMLRQQKQMLENQKTAIDRVNEGLERLTKNLAIIASSTDKISVGFSSTLTLAFDNATKAQMKAFDEQIAAAEGHEDEIEAIEARREAFIKQTNAAIVANTQVEFDRISRITLASFNAQIANGKSTVEAVQLLGPAIDVLIESAERFGFAGSAAFDQLARWRTLTTINAPLIDQVGGLTELMKALDNVGALTADTFADLQAQGVSAFDKLTAAGFTQREALQQISPLLDSIIAQSKEHGWAIDDETAALIAAAEKEKLLKGEQLSTNDILMEGLSALITVLGGDLPEAWKKMAADAKKEIEGVKPVADGVADHLADRFSKIPLRFNWDGGLPDFSGFGDFQMPEGAQSRPYPEYENRPLEAVTRDGLAMLHVGDVVGVPKGGLGGGESIELLKRIDQGIARLPIATRDAVLTAGRGRRR